MEQRHLNAIDLFVSDASDFWAEDGTLLPVIREVRANIESQASGQRVVVDRREIEEMRTSILSFPCVGKLAYLNMIDRWLSHDSGVRG